MLNSSPSRIATCVLAIGIGLTGVLVSASAPLAHARSSSPVQLKLRQINGRVDVVISGLGIESRVVSQRHAGSRWTARLSSSSLSEIRVGPSELPSPAPGLASIRLEPSADGLELIVTARPGVTMASPQISSNGADLIVSFFDLSRQIDRRTGQLDLRRPGRVDQPIVVPPMRARASAPPVGDMAVGTMLINNRSFVAVSGPPVSMTLNNAPAKDALMSLARLGGYGFVFVGDNASDATISAAPVSGIPVSLSFRNERFDRALNSVLMASGLQGKLDGQTLLVGSSVAAKTFGPQMSKVFRLNQVKVDKAANYLASLGASMNIINTITTTTGESSAAGTTQLSNQTSQATQKSTQVETFGASVGPLLGLMGTTDTRLGTVTLVGDPQLITSAESYLKQLDLRRRQVAVKVQILNVRLTNDRFVDASFSARMGDTFVVSESGKGHLNFGQNKPGDLSGSGIYGQGVSGVPGTYSSYGQVPDQRVIDPVAASQSVVNPVVQEQAVLPPPAPGEEPVLVPKLDLSGRPIYVPSSDPAAPQTLKPVYDSNGQPVYVSSTDPSAAQQLQPVYDDKGRVKYVPSSDQYRQPDNSFYAYIEAQVVAQNAKTLAQPTLLVQEGERATVETGTDVVVNVERDENGDTGTTSYTYEKETAGLTLAVDVDKIDDNGFVTMNINPSVSVPVAAPQVPGVETGGVQIFNLNKRDLESGSIRLRDGQTLIITGVVDEQQIEEVRKWPILGDLPLIGSMFRTSESSRIKDELVILVTPRVLDDDQGGVYGYGYSPATQPATRLMQYGS